MAGGTRFTCRCLLGIAVFNFIVARGSPRSAWPAGQAGSRLLLIFGIAVDVLVLGYFKYTDFLIDTANTVLQTDFLLQHILLPLGISFFTFQKIAYLVDTSRGGSPSTTSSNIASS